jgi:hypothetical protein
MNTKYAPKPNFNPNEPNLFGFARFPLHFWILNFGFAFWVLTFEFAMTTSVFLCGPLWQKIFSQKQTQFSHDQICVINIKNAERRSISRPKKTKRTQS